MVATDEPSTDIGAPDIHRIGGGSLENLRLKPREATLNPPGISVLRAPTPGEAALQIRKAFPEATDLHVASRVIGSATIESIQIAGFDLIPNPTRKLPHHYRLIHPDGPGGFSDENLKRLSEAFTDTQGY
jgi:hypothetical protein